MPGQIGSCGYLAARILRKPLVVSVVGDPEEMGEPRAVTNPYRRIAKIVSPRLLRSACRAAAVSNYVTGSSLQSKYPPGSHTEHFGISDVEIESIAEPRMHPGEPEWEIATVAMLEQPYKGIEYLIEATRILLDAGCQVRLLIIGGGRLQAAYQRLAAERIPGHCEFAGALPGKLAVEQRLVKSDVFVLASVGGEGLPRALVEAMALALPCVGTEVGGVPELLDPRFVVRPESAELLAARVRNLLTDSDQYEEQSRLNAQSAARYERATTAPEITQLHHAVSHLLPG
jgi:glycosyltransferase involved in cell wall biosynthesis